MFGSPCLIWPFTFLFYTLPVLNGTDCLKYWIKEKRVRSVTVAKVTDYCALPLCTHCTFVISLCLFQAREKNDFFSPSHGQTHFQFVAIHALSAFLGAASGGFCLCLVLSMMRLCSTVLAFRIQGNTKAGNLLSLLNLGIWWLGRLLSLLSPHEREDAVNASEPLSAQFH